MINIAICDDDLTELKQIEAMVLGCRKESPDCAISVSAFSSSETLLERLPEKFFHIYLLDIIMEGKNGIEIGKKLRETDENAVLIYLTVSPDYAVDSYTVGAYYYLLKPIKKETFLPVLTRAIQDIAKKNDFLLKVRTKGGLVSLRVGQIMYVEYHNHLVTYIMQDGSHVDSLTIRVSFDEELKPLLQLSGSPFAKISSSFIVNIDYVADVFKTGFIMADGKQLTVTRRFSEARRRYMETIIKGVHHHDF